MLTYAERSRRGSDWIGAAAAAVIFLAGSGLGWWWTTAASVPLFGSMLDAYAAVPLLIPAVALAAAGTVGMLVLGAASWLRLAGLAAADLAHGVDPRRRWQS
ncbi:hypothetical protein [Kitasatospora aureofaciens]|uniref:hypothetical protein n=1 Tax=Kitasatospora aureofaciens TaxID=1894 RepID=UPI003401AE06